MRNTGIRYNSKERMPTVLSEMAELLPPLSGEQLAVLEADLLANGCYAPVIVNEDISRPSTPSRIKQLWSATRKERTWACRSIARCSMKMICPTISSAAHFLWRV